MTRGLRLICDGVTAFALLALVALIAAKLNDAAKSTTPAPFMLPTVTV